VMSVHVNVDQEWDCYSYSSSLSAIFFFFSGFHDAGSSDVMGDLEYECLEKTLLALREERLHGDVDMTV
jgi:hypothetical protein